MLGTCTFHTILVSMYCIVLVPDTYCELHECIYKFYKYLHSYMQCLRATTGICIVSRYAFALVPLVVKRCMYVYL